MINSKLNTILNPTNDEFVRIVGEVWTEIDAIFCGIEVDEFDVIVEMSLPNSKKTAFLSYPKDSEEGIILIKELKNVRIGSLIGLLFTDIATKRIVVRQL